MHTSTNRSVLLIISVCFFLSVTTQVFAKPGWKMLEASPVSPTEARQILTSDRSEDIDKKLSLSQAAVPFSSTAHSSAEVTTDIEEMARGLQHDPKLIYEFVHNHIDYVPYFGSLKGATMTLLDRSGNDFDQASLMIALLRASGFTAKFGYGTMTIPNNSVDGNDMRHWLGVDNNTFIISRVMGNGGIPAVVQYSATVMDRVWVKANVDGNEYLFDPSFKKYEKITGIDLATAMAYDSEGLRSAAGGTVGTDFVQNLNESSIRSLLTDYTTNLINTIRTNYPNAEMEEIIGKRKIIPETFGEFSASLKFPTVVSEYWDDVPDAYLHKVRIQHGTIDQTIAIADIADKKLTITSVDRGNKLSAPSVQPIKVDDIVLQGLPTAPHELSEKFHSPVFTQPEGEPIEGFSLFAPNPLAKDPVAGASNTWDFGRISATGYSEGVMPVSNGNSVSIKIKTTLLNNSSGAYSIRSGGGTHTLKPNASLDIKVRFSGKNKPGTKGAQLRVEWWYNGERFADNRTTLVGVEASPIAIGGYGMNVVTYLGDSVSQECRIVNNGSKTLTINSMAITGSNKSHFQFVSGNGSTNIPAHSYRNITVRYRAIAHSTHNADISMSLTYDGLNYSTSPLLGLKGKSVYKPNLSDSYGVNVGWTYPSQTREGTCTIKNSSSYTLTLNSINIAGSDSSRWQILSGNGAGNLAAGATRSIKVRYLANAIGKHTPNLAVAFTFDGLANSINLPLVGETKPLPLAQLWLDDNLLASGDYNTDMIMEIDHPYAADNGNYGDETSTYKIKPGATYVIISGFGAITPGSFLKKRQRILDGYRDSGLPDSSREILSETLYVMGQTWMEETTLNNNLLAQLADVISISHHRFGIMAQESGYYVDVKTQNHSSVSRHGNTVDETTYFKTVSYLMSAMEHGVLEQLQLERPAASTIKLLTIANSTGKKIFKANGENFSTIEPQLTGYSSGDIESFRTAVADNTTLILPANGQLVLRDWKGKGYISYKQNSNGKEMGMIIGGDYNGGYGAIMDTTARSEDVANDYYPELKPPADMVCHSESKDPVDMTTGAFLFDRTDIALGSGEPNGLRFSRSYNSANRKQSSTMGYGWRHNYDMFATVHSDSSAGLGKRTPVDAASLLVASYACLNLMQDEPDTKNWVTSSLIGNWAMDELTNNSVSVHFNAKALNFIKLADGTYNPPAGVTTQLIRANGKFQLKERFGTTISFNTNDKVASWQDVDNNQMTFGYSGEKLTTVTDSFGRTLTLHYTGELLRSVSDSSSRTVSYGYDGEKNLVTYTDLAGKVWEYGYNNFHQMTTLVNPLQITTATNSYDSLGRVKTQTVPRQSESDVTYNFYFSGHRNVEQNPDGNEAVYSFDHKGREVEQQNHLGHTVQRKFDGQDHIVEAIGPRKFSTTAEYDAYNNLVSVKDALSHRSTNVYDEQHRVIETSNPLGHKAVFGYDTEHHPIATTVYPASSVPIATEISYYANGQVQTGTDGRGIETTATYDSNGNPGTSKLDTEPEISYSYDTVGRMTSLTDQGGNTTSFVYDDRGLVTSAKDPFDRTTSYTYYDDGKLQTVTDRNNQTTTSTYTVTGKVEQLNFHDASSVSFTYDKHDELTSMTDSLGVTSYIHDKAGRVMSSTDANGFTVGYNYDEDGYLGLLTSVIYPGDKRVSYTYDKLNRLEMVINWLGQVATYSYDASGRLVGLMNFNGSRAIYGYDDANRLISLENRTNTAEIISSYSFTLDGNGNRLSEERIGPVKSAVGLADLAATYEKNRLRTAGEKSYIQDEEGQRGSAGGETTYVFDPQHRLTNISNPTPSSYLYDGASNRLQSEDDGTIKRYIYDVQGDLLAEADQNNIITRYYIHGLGLLAMETVADETYCYHFDAIGNAVALTDTAQNIVNQYAYTPFGVLLNDEESVAQPFKYVGKLGVMAEENGLYYMRARYYDPEVGRFISEDPLGFDGGDVSLYVYGHNNPVLFVDPSGEFGIVGAIIGAGIEFGIQMATNGGDIDKVDWVDVAMMGAVGAVAPGAIGSAGKIFKSYKAAKVLTPQLSRAKAASRISKLGGRIDIHKSVIKSELATQGAIAVGKYGAKKLINDPGTVGYDNGYIK